MVKNRGYVLLSVLALVAVLGLTACSVPVPEALDRDCPPTFIVNDLSRRFVFAHGYTPSGPVTNAPVAARFEVERVLPSCVRDPVKGSPSSPELTLSFKTAVRLSVSKGQAYASVYPPMGPQSSAQDPQVTLLAALVDANGNVLARQERSVAFRFQKPDDTYASTLEVFTFDQVARAQPATMDRWQILVGLALSPEEIAFNRRAFGGLGSKKLERR